jgi:hypothetical protein
LRSLCAVFLLIAALGFSSTVLAYGDQGHRLIGAIADQQLHDAARLQVQKLLGVELRVAASWADCVRGVKADGRGGFVYMNDPQHRDYESACAAFDSPQQRARMQDYARRNWSNCSDPPASGCHSRYHYSNVAYQHRRYDRAYLGTREDDIVGAINATIAVLQDRAAPPPFEIRDKKEALLLLAHFVGDVHQPLHVGSAYIDGDGHAFDPDRSKRTADAQANTRGGNLIRDVTSNANLHADWDQIAPALGRTAPRKLIGSRTAVKPTPGPIGDWAAAWASESLRASHSAYAGLGFVDDPAAPGQWIAQFPDHAAYWRRKEALQRTAVIEAGTRLAQLLNAIWP